MGARRPGLGLCPACAGHEVHYTPCTPPPAHTLMFSTGEWALLCIAPRTALTMGHGETSRPRDRAEKAPQHPSNSRPVWGGDPCWRSTDHTHRTRVPWAPWASHSSEPDTGSEEQFREEGGGMSRYERDRHQTDGGMGTQTDDRDMTCGMVHLYGYGCGARAGWAWQRPSRTCHT